MKYWRLINVGRPEETEEGQGDAREFGLAVLKYWQRVDMGKNLRLEIYRSELDRARGINRKEEAANQAIDELEAFFAEMNKETEDGHE
jgi:hypothetical protein